MDASGRLLIIVMLFVVAAGLVFGIVSQRIVARRPPAYDVDAIKVGDTATKVEETYGKSSDITSDGKTQKWVYTVPRQLFIQIDFDALGHVTKVYWSGNRDAKSDG